MIVLDTTVLVYAVGGEHTLRETCRTVIREVQRGQLRATTTTEVVQEFAHVRARRRGRQDAVAIAQSYATLLRPLIAVDDDDLADGLDLFARQPPLGAFDAVLAAAARRCGADALVSADRAYAAVPDLRHLDPSAPRFAAELATLTGP